MTTPLCPGHILFDCKLVPKSHTSIDLVMTLIKQSDTCLQQLNKTFRQKAVSVTGQCMNCAALQTLLDMTGMFLFALRGTVL